MVIFVLYVYMGATLINQTQKFEDIDRCLYFAKRLTNQPLVPGPDGARLKITAVCRPQPK
jgi:hypothetical protein